MNQGQTNGIKIGKDYKWGSGNQCKIMMNWREDYNNLERLIEKLLIMKIELP